MNIRRSIQVLSVAALSALTTLVGCAASSQQGGEEESASRAVIESPSAQTSNGAKTVTSDAVIPGRDEGGTPGEIDISMTKGGDQGVACREKTGCTSVGPDPDGTCLYLCNTVVWRP